MYMTKNCENNWQIILKKTVLSCFAYFKEFFFSKKNKRKKREKVVSNYSMIKSVLVKTIFFLYWSTSQLVLIKSKM